MTLRIFNTVIEDVDFEVFAQDQPTRPVVFNASIPWSIVPAGGFASTLALHFDGMVDRRVPLTALANDARPVLPRGQSPNVFTFAALKAINPRLGSRLITLHCDWCADVAVPLQRHSFCRRHKRIGFQGTLVYTTSTFLGDVIAQPAVQQHVDSGYLHVVRFDYLPDLLSHSGRYIQVCFERIAIPTNHACVFVQAVEANHALLAMWGRNAWLLLTDLDELFSTRVPSSVGRMLRQPDGCLLHGQKAHEWWEGAPEQVHLDLVDVYCATCPPGVRGEANVLARNAAVDVLEHWTVRYVYTCWWWTW